MVQKMQLVINLSKKSDAPLYVQVAESIKDSIHRGILKPGDRLPSTRELATSAKLARLTINRAYENLASQKYISVVQGSGAYVLESNRGDTNKHGSTGIKAPIKAVSEKVVDVPMSPWAEHLMTEESLVQPAPDATAEVNYNAAQIQVLPLNLWRKALFKSIDMEDDELLSLTAEPFGYLPLREALSQYLGRARHLSCSPEQIAIFPHSESGTDMLSRILLRPGDVVGVEEPGSPGVRTTFLAHGAELFQLPIDEEGVNFETLYASEKVPRLIYLTPSHQDPTGIALKMSRRESLLKWADKKDVFIIEDDYDCEYYYGQRTLPALMSMDKHDKVIYRFNFWKSLFPLVRMGFLVVPPSLVPILRRAKMLTERNNSLLEQKALSTFISLGYYERHLRRTHAIYELRRAAVLHAITLHCKSFMKIQPITAGTHILAQFSENLSEGFISECANKAGVPLMSTKGQYTGTPTKNEFIIAFAILAEGKTDKIFKNFADAVKLGAA